MQRVKMERIVLELEDNLRKEELIFFAGFIRKFFLHLFSSIKIEGTEKKYSYLGYELMYREKEEDWEKTFDDIREEEEKMFKEFGN